MDIFKVLSRGTKRTAKPIGPTLLPSAGTKANPQLYHDEVRGMKRKRRAGDDDAGASTAAELPIVDFFAPKQESAADADAAMQPRGARAPSPAPVPAKRPTEEECRQMLRSHRLKMTLLSEREEPNKVETLKKKRKKKQRAGLEDEKKGAEKKGLRLFPQPLESFADLGTMYGVSPTVAENLARQSYRLPTEVQMGSLPLLLRPGLALRGGVGGLDDGVDFLAAAPTGSGKTVSFLVPAVEAVIRRREVSGGGGVRELEAVIVAPTRELVHQIVNEGNKLVRGTGVKIVGMKKERQLAAEERPVAGDESGEEEDEDDGDEDDDDDDDDDEDGSGSEKEQGAKRQKKTNARAKTKKPHPETKTDMLVTTPQLLLNFLRSGPRGTQRVLPTVRELILDEADVLLDPLFRDTTLKLWTACTNAKLRTSFWSATMGSNIEALVAEELKARAQHAARPQRPLVRLVVGLKDAAVPNITHKLTYTASEQGKLLALRQLLHPASGSSATNDDGPPLRPPFLVFTQTIERAVALHEELRYDIPLEAGGAARIAALHGALADAARSAIMRRFRAGEIWVLVTTDVLARGVDFAGVNGVVNFDVPASAAAYVHRAGRTGRAGREGGVAVTFYTREDIPFVRTVANVIAVSERQAGRGAGGVQKWLLDALPRVGKEDRRRLRERGMESRRSGAKISSRSGHERRKENNRRGAAEASKRRKGEGGEEEEWGGLD